LHESNAHVYTLEYKHGITNSTKMNEGEMSQILIHILWRATR